MATPQLTESELIEFQQFILNTQSIENTVRKHAEHVLAQIRNNTPERYIQLLITLTQHTTNTAIQQSTLILLRQVLIITDQSYTNSSQYTQQYVKSALLQLLLSNTDKQVNQKIIDAISMLSARYNNTITTEWTELLNTVYQLSSVQSPTQPNQLYVDNSLQLITSLCEYSIDSIKPNITQILPILTRSLQSSHDSTRLYSLQATTQLLLQLDVDERTQLQEIVPLLFQALNTAHTQYNDELIQSCCNVLIELATESSKLMKLYIAPIILLMLSIAADSKLESATRTSALEFLVTLSESATQLIKKQSDYRNNVIPLTLSFLLQIDELSHVNELNVTVTSGTTSDELMESNELFSAGCSSIQRLINSLGCKTFMSIIQSTVQQWIQSTNWLERHGALIVIGLITETEAGANLTPEQLNPFIPAILHHTTNDEYARVRYAAINCIAGCADAYSPAFQYTHMSNIIPYILQCTHDSVTIIQRQAILTLVNLFNGIVPDEDDIEIDSQKTELILQSVREQILQGLFQLIQDNNNIDVAESSVRALSSLILASQKHIIPYYDMLIAGLKSIINNANGAEQVLLRSSAIDGIGILAEAVGGNKFGTDAASILDSCIQLLSQLNPGDDQYQSLSECIGRIARICKSQFKPYLSRVIPQLIQSAQVTDAASFMDKSDAILLGDRTGYESMTLDLKELGEKQISVNTILLQEKVNATKMLYNYSTDLCELYYPYVLDTVNTLVPNLLYAYSDTVRYSATAALPALMLSVVKYYDESNNQADKSKYLYNVWNIIFEPLQTAIRAENDCESLSAITRSLIECIDCLPFALTDEQITMIHETYSVIIDECMERVVHYESDQYDDDIDEEDRQLSIQQLDIENNLLGCFYELHTKLLKCNKSNYLSLFHSQISAKYILMCSTVDQSNEPIEPLLTTGLCVLAQAVHDCGPNDITIQYANTLLQYSIPALQSSINDLRHAANYTIGACATVLGASMQSVIPQCIKLLTQSIKQSNSRNAENEPATDNAISTLCKIIKYCSVDDSCKLQLFTIILYALPCRENGDTEESMNVHEMLFYFIEYNYNQLITNDQQLQQLVNIILQLCHTPELLLPITKSKLTQFVQQHTQIQQLVNTMDKSKQDTLQQLIQSSTQVAA